MTMLYKNMKAMFRSPDGNTNIFVFVAAIYGDILATFVPVFDSH